MSKRGYAILSGICFSGAILLAALAALGHSGPNTDAQVAALGGFGMALAGRGK